MLLVLLVVAVSASGVVCQVNVTFPFGPTRFRCTTACEERQCSEKVGCRINAFDPSLDLGDGPVASRNGTFACSDKVCQPGCRELQGCTRPTGVGAPWQYSPLDAPLQLLPFRYADGRAVAAKWVTQEAVKLWDADSRTVSSFRSYFCIKVSQAPHDGGIHTTTGPDKPTAGREQQSRDDVSNLWFLISSTTSAYTSAHRRALAVFMLMDKEVTSTGDVQPRVQVGVFHDGVSSRREGWARLNESILQGADFFNRTIAVWVEYDATEKVIEVSMLPMLDMPAAAFAAACTNVRPRAQRVLKQELDLISLVNDYSYVGFEFATNGSGSSGSHEAASGPPAAGNMNEIFYWHFQTLQGEEYNGHPVADPLPAVGVGSPAASPGAKKMSPERSGRVAALIASAVAGVILLSVVGVLIVRAGSLCRRRCVGGGGSKYVPAAAGKKNWENILWWSRPPGMPMATFSIDQGAPRKFSYGELRQATNNFSPANLLGEGGFGEVYKGVLRDKCTWVAVKRIAGKSRQGEKQFLAEVSRRPACAIPIILKFVPAASGQCSVQSRVLNSLRTLSVRVHLRRPVKCSERLQAPSHEHGELEMNHTCLLQVTIIGRLRHRNLVPLRGWCHNKRGGELMLVYDFMPNSSLDHHILRPSKYRNLSRNSTDTSTSQQVESSRPVLGWATRLHIIKGVAAALLYLHEEWEEVGLKSSVVHRDIKSSNILLDAEWNARLGDFGLAMLVERDKTAETVSRIAGIDSQI